MAVKAITPDYKGEALDSVDRFHGNVMFHVNWEKHLMFCAPVAFAMPPDAPFSTLLEETLPGAYGYHPDWEKVDWSTVEWTLDHEPFEPNPEASLADNGIVHRSLLRFTVPGADGIAGTSS